MNILLKMFFYLFIVFLLTINEIHSEEQDSEAKFTKFLKSIADKICIANPEKNFADKIANCENFMRPTVFQLNS